MEEEMNETMLAVLGFATVITIIVLLLRNVTVPALAFVGVSTVTTAILVATKTFTIKEMGEFIRPVWRAFTEPLHCSSSQYYSSVL